MMVVVTLAAVMVGLSTTLIHLLLGAEREAHRAVRFHRSVMRLSETFRADVHAADRAEFPAAEPGKSTLILADAGAGREVRYEVDAHQATRVESAEGTQTHQDTFYFPLQSRLRFARPAGRNLLRLEIDLPGGIVAGDRDSGPTGADSSRRRLTIDARPGRDRMYGTPAGE
jgi:hypothetical protein